MLTISDLYPVHLHITRAYAHALSSNRSGKGVYRTCAPDRCLRGQVLSCFKGCSVITRQTSGNTLAIGEEESDASRLQGLKSFFFVTIVLFFVSIMFVLRIDMGTSHRGKGDLHRSNGMRGRCWIYVCDRWKDRIGLGRIGWDLEEGWKEELKLFFLLILLCCPLVS